LDIFKIGSCELFAWTGFEPWSSWSLILLISAPWVARITGVSHWCLSPSNFLKKLEKSYCFEIILLPELFSAINFPLSTLWCISQILVNCIFFVQLKYFIASPEYYLIHSQYII
jgi:hypothetical protein